jgi:hypothetical protein
MGRAVVAVPAPGVGPGYWAGASSAVPTGDGRFAQVEDAPVVDVRYLDVLALDEGGHRIWYEARLADERHELRTEHIPG